jgi:hypothetical protein
MDEYYYVFSDAGTYTNISLTPEHLGFMNSKNNVGFIFGKPITETLPIPIEFIGSTAQKEFAHPPHFLPGDSTRVVSEEFVAALRAAGVNNFQLFPATLYFPKFDKKWTDYYVFNEVGLVDVLNVNATKGIEIMGGFTALEKAVFSEEKLKQSPYEMFRIINATMGLYFSRRVMEILLEKEPAEEWGISWKEIEVK